MNHSTGKKGRQWKDNLRITWQLQSHLSELKSTVNQLRALKSAPRLKPSGSTAIVSPKAQQSRKESSHLSSSRPVVRNASASTMTAFAPADDHLRGKNEKHLIICVHCDFSSCKSSEKPTNSECIFARSFK